jgi:hypothetical protein
MKFPAFLWNPKFYYGVYKSPELFPALSQMNPIHALQLYFSKIRLNTLSSTPLSSEWSLPFGF